MKGDPVNDPQTAGWHWDRRLPIALILTGTVTLLGAVGQAIALTWFLANFSSTTTLRQAEMERRLTLNEDVTRRLSEANAAMAQNVAVNAETTRQVVAILTKLELKIDQFGRPSPGR